jgi:TPP-dependent 2-oxoacid decarboxylase
MSALIQRKLGFAINANLGAQVALADAAAMATCARNVVLVGDPQQLGQVPHNRERTYDREH